MGIKLKRAETAVARAKEAEQQALAEAQTASEQADAAKAVSEERETAREATREGEAGGPTAHPGGRERFSRLIDQERRRQTKSMERIERITADVNAESERARAEAGASG